MFRSFQEVRSFLSGRSIEMVDLKFCDLWGRWHHVTVPEARFDEKLLAEGVAWQGRAGRHRGLRRRGLRLIRRRGQAGPGSGKNGGKTGG